MNRPDFLTEFDDASFDSSLGILDIEAMPGLSDTSSFRQTLHHLSQRGSKNFKNTAEKPIQPLSFESVLSQNDVEIPSKPVQQSAFFQIANTQWTLSSSSVTSTAHTLSSEDDSIVAKNTSALHDFSEVDFNHEKFSARSTSLNGNKISKTLTDVSSSSDLKGLPTSSNHSSTLKGSAGPKSNQDKASCSGISLEGRPFTKSVSGSVIGDPSAKNSFEPFENQGNFSFPNQPQFAFSIEESFQQGIKDILQDEKLFNENKSQAGENVDQDSILNESLGRIDITAPSFVNASLFSTHEVPERIEKDRFFQLKSYPRGHLGDPKNRPDFGMSIQSPRNQALDDTNVSRCSEIRPNSKGDASASSKKELKKSSSRKDDGYNTASGELSTIDDQTYQSFPKSVTDHSRSATLVKETVSGNDEETNTERLHRCYSASHIPNHPSQLSHHPLRSRSVNDTLLASDYVYKNPHLQPPHNFYAPAYNPIYPQPEKFPLQYVSGPGVIPPGIQTVFARPYPPCYPPSVLSMQEQYHTEAAAYNIGYQVHDLQQMKQDTSILCLSGPVELYSGFLCLGSDQEVVMPIVNPGSTSLMCSFKILNCVKELSLKVPDPVKVLPKNNLSLSFFLTGNAVGKFEMWIEVISRIPCANTLIGSFVTHVSVVVEKPKIKAFGVSDSGELFDAVDFGSYEVGRAQMYPRLFRVQNFGAATVSLLVILNTEHSNCNFDIVFLCCGLHPYNKSVPSNFMFLSNKAAIFELLGNSIVNLPLILHSTTSHQPCKRAKCSITGTIQVSQKGEMSTTKFNSVGIQVKICHRNVPSAELKAAKNKANRVESEVSSISENLSVPKMKNSKKTSSAHTKREKKQRQLSLQSTNQTESINKSPLREKNSPGDNIWTVKPKKLIFERIKQTLSFAVVNLSEKLLWFQIEGASCLEIQPRCSILRPSHKVEVKVTLLSRTNQLNVEMVTVKCNGTEKFLEVVVRRLPDFSPPALNIH